MGNVSAVVVILPIIIIFFVIVLCILILNHQYPDINGVSEITNDSMTEDTCSQASADPT